MSDPYGDPDLVALYDVDNPAGDDLAYVLALAEEIGARRVLDLGCGTGLLTRALAPGRSVIGVDPSSTMLDWAAQQPGAEAVRWVLGDADAIRPDADLDLVISTGNAVMHIADADLDRSLRRIAAGLRPGGVFAFDTRNPAGEQWREWTRAATEGERQSPLGLLREWIDVTSTALDADGEGLVVFDAHNVLPDGSDRVYRSELWFRGVAALTRALGEAGFSDPRIDGGWHGEPVTTAARPLVVRAARRG